MVDFGTDLSCYADLDPQGRDVSGYELLAQAVFRRLITPRGQLIDDPNYGLDLRGLLHKGMTQAEIAALPGMIRQEVLKDERIDRCEVEFTRTGGDVWRARIRCTAGEGAFELVLSVDNAKVALLSEAA